MTKKPKLRDPGAARITPQMVAAFLRGDEAWFRRLPEFEMPWKITPVHGNLDEPCEYPEGIAGWDDYHKAQNLRLAILLAIADSPDHCRDRELQREVAATITQIEKLREGRR